MFEIEKGVEIPPAARKTRNRKYPWHQMEVGDSFLVPYGDYEPRKLLSRLTAVASFQSKNNGKYFASRRLPEGVRVWRTA